MSFLTPLSWNSLRWYSLSGRIVISRNVSVRIESPMCTSESAGIIGATVIVKESNRFSTAAKVRDFLDAANRFSLYYDQLNFLHERLS